MENLVYTDQLYATRYADEVTALHTHIVAATDRTAQAFSSLEQRAGSALGPVAPERILGEPLLSSSDTDMSEVMTPSADTLFHGYTPTGRLQDGSALTAQSLPEDEADEDIASQFWGETTKVEKLRTRVASIAKTIGTYAVKAFKTLEEGLSPVVSEAPESDDAETLAYVLELAERIDRQEKANSKQNALARAVACVAIAATIPTGAAIKSLGGAQGIRPTYAVEQTIEAPAIVSEVRDEVASTTTTTSLPEQTTTSTTAAPEPQPMTRQAEPKPAVVSQAANDAECAVTRLKAAPIEDVIDVAQKLMHTHGLTEQGSAMLTANFTVETGDLNPMRENTSEGAIGLAQWRGERQDGMPSDRDGQLAFAINIEMPRDGKSYLVKLLRDPSATFAQLRDGLADWERYGEEGGRTELGKKLFRFMQKCL